MSNNFLITSKLELHSAINRQNFVVFYIEDYLSIASVSEARKLTDEIFTHNTDFIQEHDYKGYKITWSWYNDVFDFCLKYLEIKKLVEAVELLEFEQLTLSDISPHYRKVLILYFFNKKIIFKESRKSLFFTKLLIINFLMLLYSTVSILFLSISKKKLTATYTGDFIYKNSTSDFRYKNLYDKYEKNSIDYIEFIRETSTINFFKNIYKRKRFLIYFKSITFFVNLFTKERKYHQQPIDFYQSVIYRFHHDNFVLKKSVFILEKIIKIIRIDKVVLLFFASRNAEIAIAAKSLGVKTIGIMHGVAQKEFAVYEFLESYDEKKKIGCDVYGVWSLHYLEYFQKYSKTTKKENFHYSGLLRPVNQISLNDSFKLISSKRIKILIISEPLISVQEIIPYLKCLLMHDDIEMAFKVRPMIKDIYYEEMKNKFPDIQDLEVYDGKIEEVGKNFDVFIGSNSTAVIEASLLGKISILLHTIKFGDYFDMDTLISNQPLLIRRPEDLYNNLLFRINSERSLNTVEKIRTKFFGENKDGSQWIIDQL